MISTPVEAVIAAKENENVSEQIGFVHTVPHYGQLIGSGVSCEISKLACFTGNKTILCLSYYCDFFSLIPWGGGCQGGATIMVRFLN